MTVKTLKERVAEAGATIKQQRGDITHLEATIKILEDHARQRSQTMYAVRAENDRLRAEARTDTEKRERLQCEVQRLKGYIDRALDETRLDAKGPRLLPEETQDPFAYSHIPQPAQPRKFDY